METMIFYDFAFVVAIKKRNGKIKDNYSLTASGYDYGTALFDACFTLKRRRYRIISVKKAQAVRIAFAMDGEGNWIQCSLAEHPATIPEDLNSELDYLPQNYKA